MESWERARLIARIVSGETRLTLNSQTFYIRSPSRSHRCMADEIFFQCLEDSEVEDIVKQEDIHGLFWSSELEDKLGRLEADIENLKLELFKKRFQSLQGVKIREMLGLSRVEYERLLSLKHSYDNFSRLGLAQSARDRYLLGFSIFREDNSPYWVGEASWDEPDLFLNRIQRFLYDRAISVEQFRELARTEPWVTTWSIQKYCEEKIFRTSSFDITEDQKTLIIWSSIYESIREHPDKLDKEIVEDDDMIDGWMILKRKERGGIAAPTDELSPNKKIRGAAEQFYPVDTAKDAVNFMNRHNSESAKQVINEKLTAVKQQGVVAEQHMPSTKNMIQQEKQRRVMELMNKNKKG